MVGTTKPPRRARAISGYGSNFESGQVDGHRWPLEYAPRWTTDHHPWRIATAPTCGIRFASYEIVEAGGRDA
jgi:hypothetical protein